MNSLTRNITTASAQWASRPDDQRFISLDEMSAFQNDTRKRSVAKAVSSRRIQLEPIAPDDLTGLRVVGPNGNPANMTHFSFGQIAQLAGLPAGTFRTLPAPITADAINWKLRFDRDVEDVGVLLTYNGADMAKPDSVDLRAATGPNYGRVWNAQITDALRDRFGDGITGDFRVPGIFGQPVDVTKRNTTLYASDRDMFVFLADETNRIACPDRRNGQAGSLARGFFVWNSETGSKSIGAAFFLFDYVCGNRIVWGATQYKEIRLRHSVGAPDRWLSEISPVLIEYANSEAKPVEDAIAAAKARKLDDAKAWLANRYTVRQASAYSAAFERDEGRPIETLWDVATGMTAYARSIPHADARVEVERAAGKVLDLAAA